LVLSSVPAPFDRLLAKEFKDPSKPPPLPYGGGGGGAVAPIELEELVATSLSVLFALEAALALVAATEEVLLDPLEVLVVEFCCNA
jgi:hypothetical protein